VALRYAAAVEASTAALVIAADPVEKSAVLKRIDVRRKGAFDAAPDVIAGAQWRDPETVSTSGRRNMPAPRWWSTAVYGHEVGQSTAARLRDAGIVAHFLSGGIEDWKKAGKPTQAK